MIDSISAEALGEPGVKGRYYDLGLLFETLLAHRKADQYDLVVGFTHFEITEGDRKQYDANEIGYFSLSNWRNAAMISRHPNIVKHSSPLRDIYQYAQFLLAGELLGMLSRNEDLFHEQPARCLFEECEAREDFRLALESATICVQSRAALKTAGVSESAINAVEKILKSVRRSSASKLAPAEV